VRPRPDPSIIIDQILSIKGGAAKAGPLYWNRPNFAKKGGGCDQGQTPLLELTKFCQERVGVRPRPDPSTIIDQISSMCIIVTLRALLTKPVFLFSSLAWDWESFSICNHICLYPISSFSVHSLYLCTWNLELALVCLLTVGIAPISHLNPVWVFESRVEVFCVIRVPQ
jgi:hypothetical protein